MADKEYKIKISIDSKELKNNLSKNTQSVKQFADKSTKSIGSLNIAWGAFLGNIASQAFTRSLSNIRTFFSDTITLAQVQEDAVNSLNASLKQSGDFTEELSQELQNYASELQNVSRFGDEAIINQMAFAQSMGASAEQSKTIVAAAIDMSEALNIDLNSAVRNISKTLGGYAGELGEVIPELKDLTQEQLRAGEGVELLASRYEGRGAAALNTFSGQLQNTKNAFGDMQEEIGNTLIKSPEFIQFLADLKTSFVEITPIVAEAALSVSKLFSEFYTFVQRYSKDSDVAKKSLVDLKNEQEELLSMREDSSGTPFWTEEEAKRLKEVTEEINRQSGAVANLNNLLGQSGNNMSTPMMSTEIKENESSKQTESPSKKLNAKELEALEERKQFIAQKNEEIRNIQLQHYASMDELQRANFEMNSEKSWEDFDNLIEIYGEQNAIELQMLQDKIDAEQDLKKKAKLQEELEAKKDLKLQQKRNKEINKQNKEAEKIELQGKQDFFNNLGILSRTGSKELFAINKAANIARITANIPDTVSSAYKAGSAIGGPPVGGAFAATALAAQVALLQQQAQAQPPAFQEGGILNSGGTSLTGDNNLARFNDREMFLNMRQQSTLFNAINSGALGGSNLSNDLLAELVDIQRTKNTEFNINGETLNNELNRINERRL